MDIKLYFRAYLGIFTDIRAKIKLENNFSAKAVQIQRKGLKNVKRDIRMRLESAMRHGAAAFLQVFSGKEKLCAG